MKNIFKNFFGTEKEETAVSVTDAQAPIRYSTEIEQIHHEFQIASDILVVEATKIIEETNKKPVDKVKRLLSMGFTQAQQVDETKTAIEQAELSKDQLDSLVNFRRKYPLNRFITEEQVKSICYKYNLICGDVSKYKGFVPEKNMKEIEKFKLRDEDRPQVEVIDSAGNHIGYALYADLKDAWWIGRIKEKTSYVAYYDTDINLKGGGAKWGNFSMMRDGANTPLKICAPVKDMDMTGMTISDGYRMTKIHIPDPVVLQPVQGGYLILTAWGDEASDPLVVNEINN